MRRLAVLLIHFIAVLARSLGPGGVRSLIAESLLLKHQILILNLESLSETISQSTLLGPDPRWLDGALGGPLQANKPTLHRETKDLPVYALIVAKDGPKIQEAKPGDTYPNGIKGIDGTARPGVTQFGWGLLKGQGISIANLAQKLSRQHLGRPVVDKTGLTGQYDYTLKWAPDLGRLLCLRERRVGSRVLTACRRPNLPGLLSSRRFRSSSD